LGTRKNSLRKMTLENQALGTRKNSLRKMTLENQALGTRKNSLRKMTLENQALRTRKNSLRKMTLENQALRTRKNYQVLQITQNILEENHQIIHQLFLIKKTLDLKKRKNLKKEIAGLKILPLKNIIKKE
jgi:hypothetical protein